MPSNWPLVQVSEVAEKVGMGPFGSSIKVSTFVSEGVPIISGQHLHEVRLQDGEYNHVTYEHADKLKNANVYRGDVIFTHAGNIEHVAFIPNTSRFQRYILSQRQFYLRCDKSKLLPEFATYFFHSPEGRHKLLANAAQTGVPSIAQPVTYLKTIAIPLPPLPEQRAIAHILGTLDDKIELNRRMNQTLEEIARAIFQSWFIDFDPVRAKAAGRQPECMDAETAALFPDAFVDSELGEIPAGWSVLSLEALLELSYGKALKASDRIPGDTPVFGSNGQVGWHNQPLVEGPGIIVGRKGNPGTVTWSQSGFFPIDTAFFVVPASKEVRLTFLYFMLQHLTLAQYGADSAVPGLSRNIAYTIQAIKPSMDLVQRFDNVVKDLFSLIHQYSNQMATISEVRDAILPKLLSGEFRISPDTDNHTVEP